PTLAAPGHDGAHPERQQGRRDHLLRRPRAARPLRSSRTHLADKDGFDMKWKPPFRGYSGTLAQASGRCLLASPRPPIFELGPRASEDDPLAGDAPRADLAGVEVLDDVRRDQRGEHEDADGRVRVVADLVRALLAARERDDVALPQLLLAPVRAQRRPAAEA